LFPDPGGLEMRGVLLVLSLYTDNLTLFPYHLPLCLRYDDAMSNFDTALKNLRGNLLIDYKQLGLQYKLYSCEILYNRAYVLCHKGRNAEAREELEKAKQIAADASESRQRIVNAALENMKAGNSFQPYKLPKNSMVFMPPRHKTEVLRPVNFMGKAKVLSSIVDQDDYTGFAGTQVWTHAPRA